MLWGEEVGKYCRGEVASGLVLERMTRRQAGGIPKAKVQRQEWPDVIFRCFGRILCVGMGVSLHLGQARGL